MEKIEEATTSVYYNSESTEILNSPRVMCSTSKLNKLIGTKCHMSNCDGNYKLNFETSGCCLLIKGSCENGHSFNWTSSDVVHSSSGKKVFSDNLHVSSAIVLSGNSLNKIELFFQFMNLRFISSTSFFAH